MFLNFSEYDIYCKWHLLFILPLIIVRREASVVGLPQVQTITSFLDASSRQLFGLHKSNTDRLFGSNKAAGLAYMLCEPMKRRNAGFTITEYVSLFQHC